MHIQLRTSWCAATYQIRTILILINDLHCLTSLDTALIFLLFLVVGNGHIAFQNEGVTNLGDLGLALHRLQFPAVYTV